MAEKVHILQKKNPQNSIFIPFSKFWYQNVGKTIGYCEKILKKLVDQLVSLSKFINLYHFLPFFPNSTGKNYF